jgi:hypothetical protein
MRMCNQHPDLPGYQSIPGRSACLDVTGKGIRNDYCREVVKHSKLDNSITDRFIACDLQSKGGFSYWFRSPTEAEGIPRLELPYASKLHEERVDSYCGVIAPDSINSARAACLTVTGLGFGSGLEPDPNPPEHIRARIRTYENLVLWYPLLSHKLVGSFRDRVRNLPLQISPPSGGKGPIPLAGGTPRLATIQPLPMNETVAISLMVRPTYAQSGANEMMFFAGDDAYMNEISISRTITNQLQFQIYEGKALAFSLQAGALQANVWNHILFQYKNGYWHLFVDGMAVTKKMGDKHSFMKRHNGLLGSTLPQHTEQPFTGEIADVRLYSRTLDTTGIQAILTDFKKNQQEETK